MKPNEDKSDILELIGFLIVFQFIFLTISLFCKLVVMLIGVNIQ